MSRSPAWPVAGATVEPTAAFAQLQLGFVDPICRAHGPQTRLPIASHGMVSRARHPHEYWFIDGRRMDFAMDGVQWWSLIILGGLLADHAGRGCRAHRSHLGGADGALYRLSALWGPRDLVSDSGGAYTSNDFEAVCTRLQIHHETIESTQGESYQNLMETHFNIQRRLYDYQFSLARTPAELEQRHQAFIQTYNTTAHQGLLKDRRLPPIPVEVLGAAKGRRYSPGRARPPLLAGPVPPDDQPVWLCHLAQLPLLCGRGGLPTTQVLLWVSGDRLRAVFDNVVVAE